MELTSILVVALYASRCYAMGTAENQLFPLPPFTDELPDAFRSSHQQLPTSNRGLQAHH